MRFVLFYIFLFFSISLLSQSYSVLNYRGELNIKISVQYEKQMDKIIMKLNENEQIEKELINKITEIQLNDTLNRRSKEYIKAIAKIHDVCRKYGELHQQMFNIFSENCELSRARMKSMHHYSSGLLKAKYYEQRAAASLKKSKMIREVVYVADMPGWIQYKMSEAMELEKLAIRDKGRALNIMQDFPVEYNYGWENDVTPEEVEAALGDPAINRPPDDLFVQKQDTVIEEEVNDTVVKQKNVFVLFSVQIAAHTTPLTPEYLRQIYQGDLPVDEKKEDQWFKYTIGNFYNFNEANHLLKTCRVKRAFIVAYSEGKKLTIKEALELIRKNQ